MTRLLTSAPPASLAQAHLGPCKLERKSVAQYPHSGKPMCFGPASPEATARLLAHKSLEALLQQGCDGAFLEVLVQGKWSRLASVHHQASVASRLSAHVRRLQDAASAGILARFLALGTPRSHLPDSPLGHDAFWQHLLGGAEPGQDCGWPEACALPIFSASGRTVAIAVLLGPGSQQHTQPGNSSAVHATQQHLLQTLNVLEPHLLAAALAQMEQQAALAAAKLQLLSHTRKWLASCTTVPKMAHALARALLQLPYGVRGVCVGLESHRNADRCLALCHRDSAKEDELRREFARKAPQALNDIYPALNSRAAMGPGSEAYPLTIRGQNVGAVRVWRDDAGTETLAASHMLSLELMGCAQDAMEKIWLQEEAAHSKVMRENFLSVASHELRTPLTALNLQLESVARMLRRHPHQEISQSMGTKLARAFKQTGKLSSLIDNLLDVMALRSGAMQMARCPVQVKDFLATVFARWVEEAKRAGCALSVQCPQDVTGMWDGYRMEQVLDHLMANAVKYGAGRPIHLSVQQTEDALQLTLKDNGIGVPTDVAERIFGAFERAVSPRQFGGLGLGLYLSRSIVEAHGGHMKLSLDNSDGAEFTISLPKQNHS